MAILENTPRQASARREFHGLGVVIINAQTGQIWSIKERTSKPETGREPGELSLPMETRKFGESRWLNLLGALAEAYDDVDIHGRDRRLELQQSLCRVDNYTFHPGVTFETPGSVVRCGIAVLIHKGDTSVDEIQPYNAAEVGEAQWSSVGSLLVPGVRPLARAVVAATLDRGVYQQTIRAYRQFPKRRLPVFPREFSIREIYHRREQSKDMHT